MDLERQRFELLALEVDGSGRQHSKLVGAE